MKKKYLNLEEFVEKQLPTLKIRVRKQAIKNIKKELIFRNKTLKDISDSDIEFLLAEEEEKIWRRFKKGGVFAIALAFGVAWF